MTVRGYAVTADENGRIEEAAAGYEASLLADPGDLEATVNLAVLYWRAIGRGCCSSVPLRGEFPQHARARLHELLDSASEQFAGRAEIRFWKKYIAAADCGGSLGHSECRQLLLEHPNYLEPAFVVFSSSAGVEAEPEAMRLLVDYAQRPTARGRYVTSIINAAMRLQRWRDGRELLL
jgi:hypothetical protein